MDGSNLWTTYKHKNKKWMCVLNSHWDIGIILLFYIITGIAD